jgi:hypothetical protein
MSVNLKWDGRFVFMFVLVILVEAGLLNCITCNPVPRENQEPSSQGDFGTATSLRLTRGSSWDLGDRAKRCLSEDPAPATYSAVPKIS